MNLHNSSSPRIIFFPVKYFIVVAEFNVKKITKVAALFVNSDSDTKIDRLKKKKNECSCNFNLKFKRKDICVLFIKLILSTRHCIFYTI